MFLYFCYYFTNQLNGLRTLGKEVVGTDGRMFRYHTLYHASEEPPSLSHTLANFPAILSYLWTLQASLHGAQLLLLHLTHALTHDTATSVRNVADNDKASLSGNVAVVAGEWCFVKAGSWQVSGPTDLATLVVV